MVNILVVGDHPLVRKGIVCVLREAFPITNIAEACNGAEVLKATASQMWSMVLLDISLPGRSGIDVLKDIKERNPRIPVMMLSAYDETQFAIRALRAGAAGVLNKDCLPEVLIGATRQVLAGKKFISESVAETLADEMTVDSTRPVHEQLSDREYDVMVKIAAGASVSEVAAQLNLSVKTISTYRGRILEKMHLKNNAQLSQYAIRNNLID